MKALVDLVERLRREAKAARRRSDQTWNKLVTGELDQIDSIIYSVYEENAFAKGLDSCADELEKVIKKEKKCNRSDSDSVT